MTSSPKNIIEKIWDAHTVEQTHGYPNILAIDLHLIHEVTSPQAFEELKKRKLPLSPLTHTVATVDHNISTSLKREFNEKTPKTDSQKQILSLRENCKAFGVKLLDAGSGKQGIVHVIGPELGLTQPGNTIVCGDSHTSTHGAFGSLAFGIGTTQVGHVMATGCLLMEKPATMKIEFKGKLGLGISAKDLILKLIQKIGVGGATGHILEYTGEAIEALNMEERMTLCNMSIEAGAQAGLIAPDETTFNYLKGRLCAPKGEEWAQAVNYWKTLQSDPGALFDRVVEIDIEGMSPMVTWGFNPAQSIEIDQLLPRLEDLPEGERLSAQKAYQYTGLEPGKPLAGTPVDYVFIGSCTNARISDLRAAAHLLKGKKISKEVVVYLVPGSEAVKSAAIEEGLDQIFEAAGITMRNPGCSMCLAMNEDKVPAKKRCASTSNRNFVGRQGPDSITHLMSPIMAACAAITGKITDVRPFLNA